MKIKKIFSKIYDGPWNESGLDYEVEIKPFKKKFQSQNLIADKIDELYLAFRNAAASVNSYTIKEIEVPNPEICHESYSLSDYTKWGQYIWRHVREFNHKYGLMPVILTANSQSLDKLKNQINSEFPEGSQVDKYELTHFLCPEFDIHFCIDQSLKDDQIGLIYSDQAQIISENRKLLELVPAIQKQDKFGEMIQPEKSLPYWVSAPVVKEFTNRFYESNLTVNFDWPHWEQGLQILSDANFDYNKIDLATINKLITVLIRRDRFAEGSLIAAFQSGLILKLLKAIEEQTREYSS